MRSRRFWVIAAILAPLAGSVAAQPRAIDTKSSTMTVEVHRAGMLSALGHDHAIAAPVAAGTVDVSARRVELRVDTRTMRVNDTKGSEKDRAEVQKTMSGPEVLDVERYPEIVFRSVAAEQAGAGSWKIRGDLTLHGSTKAVAVEVVEKAGRYTGHAVLKQSDFGITPIRVAGGTVRVQDEVRIVFDIGLAH